MWRDVGQRRGLAFLSEKTTSAVESRPHHPAAHNNTFSFQRCGEKLSPDDKWLSEDSGLDVGRTSELCFSLDKGNKKIKKINRSLSGAAVLARLKIDPTLPTLNNIVPLYPISELRRICLFVMSERAGRITETTPSRNGLLSI